MTLTPCPPGQYRTYSSLTPSNTSASVSTMQAVPTCQLCPPNTYKIAAGDDISLCRPCPAKNSTSSSNRILCSCSPSLIPNSNINQTDKDQSLTTFFNILSGSCQILTVEAIRALSDEIWSQIMNEPNPNPSFNFNSDSSVTRYREFPCEPGYYCANGLRFKCPAGFYGSVEQETRPQCAGLCMAGYYCPLGSTSPYQNPCGGFDRYCPTGSSLPLLVTDGYYTNEDDYTGKFRSFQTIWYVFRKFS